MLLYIVTIAYVQRSVDVRLQTYFWLLSLKTGPAQPGRGT